MPQRLEALAWLRPTWLPWTPVSPWKLWKAPEADSSPSNQPWVCWLLSLPATHPASEWHMQLALTHCSGSLTQGESQQLYFHKCFRFHFFFPLSLFCCPPQGCLPVILSPTHIPTNPRCINRQNVKSKWKEESIEQISWHLDCSWANKVKHPQVKHWAGRKAPALWQQCLAGLCQWHCSLGTWPLHSHTVQNFCGKLWAGRNCLENRPLPISKAFRTISSSGTTPCAILLLLFK